MCCGWRKIDFPEERKLWMCKLLKQPKFKLKPYKQPLCREYSTGGDAMIKLWMTDKEAAEFNIEIDKDYYNIVTKRNMRFQEEAIIHMIYLKYPEMFEE